MTKAMAPTKQRTRRKVLDEQSVYYREHSGDRRGWRFEKRLSLDTVISVIGMSMVIGGPFFYWATGMQSRVLILESANIATTKQDAAREMVQRDQQNAVTARLDKLEQKVTDVQVQLGTIDGKVTDGFSRNIDRRR